MPIIEQTCPECGRTFKAGLAERRTSCSVLCQFHVGSRSDEVTVQFRAHVQQDVGPVASFDVSDLSDEEVAELVSAASEKEP